MCHSVNEPFTLKCCPFCGGKAEIYYDKVFEGSTGHTVGCVICKTCRIQTHRYTVDGYYGVTTTINNAIEDWNKRVDTT